MQAGPKLKELRTDSMKRLVMGCPGVKTAAGFSAASCMFMHRSAGAFGSALAIEKR